MFDSSIYKLTELLWLSRCWIDNGWFSQLLTIDVHQALLHLDTPLSKCGIFCKLRDKVKNLPLSLVGVVDLVLLEVSHLSLVLCEILWKTCFVAKLSWQVNSFSLVASRLVDVEQWLLIVKLDLVLLIEVLLHANFCAILHGEAASLGAQIEV